MKISNPTASLGEDLAVEFLKKHKFKILERNFRKQYGEIDIIALDYSDKKNITLVFVEVKTRNSYLFGTPAEAITYRKIQEMIKTGQLYTLMHPELPDSLRLDAVTVLLNNDYSVKHIELIKNIEY